VLLRGVRWRAGKTGGVELDEDAEEGEFEVEGMEGVAAVVVVGGKGWEGEGVRADGGGRGIESDPRGGRFGFRIV
jgi:hypothetical protein